MKKSFSKTFDCDLPLALEVCVENSQIQKVHFLPSKGLACTIYGDDCLDINESIFTWLEAYSRRQEPSVALSLNLGTISAYQGKALSQVRQIPFASIKSYKEIASKIGNERASRAVGNACRVNPFPLFIPCHRVVGSNGKLTGFAYGLELKRLLLHFERGF